MLIPGLKEFSLVGGTALALKYGHRKSVDLDLFSENEFNNSHVISILETEFPGFRIENNIEKFGIFCYVENVKVDIVKHPHPLIADIEIIEGIRMYSTPDIAAMKINAILGRGRKKDFWDLQELLEHYSVEQIINFYEKKFFNQHLLIGIAQAIIYFTDAEDSDTPVSLKRQTWGKVKKFIEKKVRNYLK